MTLREAVEKAVDGGWCKYVEGDQFSVMDAVEANKVQVELTVDGYEGELAEALIDPEFWQGLGKSLGWTDWADNDRGGHIRVWLYNWHQFIDYLAEGKGYGDFFKDLK